MHLTEKQEIARMVLLELADQLRQTPFWVPLANELESRANRGGPERPTTPTSGNT